MDHGLYETFNVLNSCVCKVRTRILLCFSSHATNLVFMSAKPSQNGGLTLQNVVLSCQEKLRNYKGASELLMSFSIMATFILYLACMRTSILFILCTRSTFFYFSNTTAQTRILHNSSTNFSQVCTRVRQKSFCDEIGSEYVI